MVKRLRFVAAGLAVLAFLAACRMDMIPESSGDTGVKSIAEAAEDSPVDMNPDPAEIGPLPPATVPLLKPGTPAASMASKSLETPLLSEPASAALTPDILAARLRPGESVTEHKTAFLPADVRPPMGDILFSFDLTSSMSQELNNVKNNAQNILTAIRVQIPDTRFGVVSHMDYNGFFYSPGYGTETSPIRYGGLDDYPYRLDQALTDDTGAAVTAIQDLVMGYGADLPESYTRVFYESYADPNIGWREGSRKILLAWLDAIPHDPDFAKIYNPDLNRSTGVDPGRDGQVGTLDDLEILPVLQGMADRKITLIVLYSNADLPASVPPVLRDSDYWGTGFPLWQAYAEVTGGSAFKINTNGTIPDGTNLDDFVAGLIGGQVGRINSLSLQAADPAYAGWLTSVIPASYTGVELDEDKTFEFDIVVTVPPAAATGTHEFTVALVGDGVVYAEQAVSIEVYTDIEVSLDIKPGSCPNPFNVNAKGVLPAAVAGTGMFDTALIDPSTLRLNGVAPVRWNFEDVTAPFEPYTDKPLDENACLRSGPDGYMDLTLKFATEEIAVALGPVADGEILALYLTGELYDGTAIKGEDIVRIIKKK